MFFNSGQIGADYTVRMHTTESPGGSSMSSIEDFIRSIRRDTWTPRVVSAMPGGFAENDLNGDFKSLLRRAYCPGEHLQQ